MCLENGKRRRYYFGVAVHFNFHGHAHRVLFNVCNQSEGYLRLLLYRLSKGNIKFAQQPHLSAVAVAQPTDVIWIYVHDAMMYNLLVKHTSKVYFKEEVNDEHKMGIK